MSTCMPSPGPMWATWLKLVGLEIILDRSSGSLSISLQGAVEGGGVRPGPASAVLPDPAAPTSAAAAAPPPGP